MSSESDQPPSTAALQFEYEATLAEYRVTWSEMETRVQVQQQLINYAFVLLAALAAFTQLASGDRPLEITLSEFAPVMPVFSLIFSAFALMYLEQDVLIASLLVTIEMDLRPSMAEILEKLGSENALVIWNSSYKRNLRHRTGRGKYFVGIMTGARFVPLCVISFSFIALYVFLRNQLNTALPLLEFVLFVLSVLVFACVIATILFDGFYYRKIVTSSISRSGQQRKRTNRDPWS